MADRAWNSEVSGPSGRRQTPLRSRGPGTAHSQGRPITGIRFTAISRQWEWSQSQVPQDPGSLTCWRGGFRRSRRSDQDCASQAGAGGRYFLRRSSLDPCLIRVSIADEVNTCHRSTYQASPRLEHQMFMLNILGHGACTIYARTAHLSYLNTQTWSHTFTLGFMVSQFCNGCCRGRA